MEVVRYSVVVLNLCDSPNGNDRDGRLANHLLGDVPDEQSIGHRSAVAPDEDRIEVVGRVQNRPGTSPPELQNISGASEATLSRILNEFDGRGWAERDVEGEPTRPVTHEFICEEDNWLGRTLELKSAGRDTHIRVYNQPIWLHTARTQCE